METVVVYDSPLDLDLSEALHELVAASGAGQLTAAQLEDLLATPGARVVTVGLHARLVGFAVHVPSTGLHLAVSGYGSRTLAGLVVARVGRELGVTERLVADVIRPIPDERIVAALPARHPALRVLRAENWRTIGTQDGQVILAAPEHATLAGYPAFGHV